MSVQEPIIARRYEVFGLVQGVGFRYFVHRTAQGLGVSGWVRNRADGSVEAWAEGGPDAIASFRAGIGEGPRVSRVDKVEEFPVVPANYDAFRVTG